MRTQALDIRVTPNEKLDFQEAAALAGVTLSAWARGHLRAALRRELPPAHPPVGMSRSSHFAHGSPLRKTPS